LGRKESGFAPDAEGGGPRCGIGGLSVFIEFLRKIGYRKQVSERLPVHLESPNAIDPGEAFTAFLISVVVPPCGMVVREEMQEGKRSLGRKLFARRNLALRRVFDCQLLNVNY
jgi:hypothetical protein